VYDPFLLMNGNDFIFVAANYRLGPMGFLALEGTSGNMGLLDQNMALKWISDNAAAFGGDPNHITIGGESAGAFSTCWHLASPTSKGLFHAAIMESGTCDAPEFFRTTKNAISFSQAVAKSLKCNGTDAQMVDCLRKIGVGQLMSMFPDLSQYHDTNYIPALYPVMPWGAAVGELSGGALPDIPTKIIQSGQWNDVPLMIGTNANESNLFLFFLPERAEPVYDDLFNDFFFRNATLIAQIKQLYNWSNPEQKQRDKFSTMMTDYIFTCPSRRAIKAASALNPSWMYQWDYRSGIAEKLIGDAHATEIVYVFQHPFVLLEFSPKDRQIAHMMQHYFVNFIKTYNPNSQSKPAYVNWLPYKSDRLYLEIEDPATTRMDEDLRRVQCDFWDIYFASY